MTKIKKLGAIFLKEDGWKVGDKVKCTKSTHSAYKVGETYTLKENVWTDRLCPTDGANGFDGEFELVEETKWSDWEEADMAYEHSKFQKGCLVECREIWEESSYETISRKYRVSLPKRVPVKTLPGTVQVDKDGNPDFSTYKKD